MNKETIRKHKGLIVIAIALGAIMSYMLPLDQIFVAAKPDLKTQIQNEVKSKIAASSSSSTHTTEQWNNQGNNNNNQGNNGHDDGKCKDKKGCPPPPPPCKGKECCKDNKHDKYGCVVKL